MTPRCILLTGATGNMGSAALTALLARDADAAIRCLVLPTERDHPVVRRHKDDKRVVFVFGDLRRADQVKTAIDGCDLVLHVGGMVSPFADHHPELTTAVNVGGAANIVAAIKAQPDPDAVALVYIGTVARTGHRPAPIHWGRTGDPIRISQFDHYARTKTEAEAIVAESGLKRWVSLRQTGIIHPGLWKIVDPIMFHNPFNDVFEWVTVEDAGRLMACVAFDAAPEDFWRGFYNIGGGAALRLMNHEFAGLTGQLGGGDFRKGLDVRLFARRNFHGQWYADSDRLADLFAFRTQGLDEVLAMLKKAVPAPARAIARLAPGLVRQRMAALARGPGGPLWWEANDDRAHLDAYFGSGLKPSLMPDWDQTPLLQADRTPRLLDHGYDQKAALDALTAQDLDQAAAFRGLRLVERHPDPYAPSLWRDADGDTVPLSANLMLRGGHWHGGKMLDVDQYARTAKTSPFLKQVML